MNERISVTELSRQGEKSGVERIIISGEYRGQKGRATILFFGDIERTETGQREKHVYLPTSQLEPQGEQVMRRIGKYSIPRWLASNNDLLEHEVNHV